VGLGRKTTTHKHAYIDFVSFILRVLVRGRDGAVGCWWGWVINTHLHVLTTLNVNTHSVYAHTLKYRKGRKSST